MSPFFIRKENESRGFFAFKIAGVALLGIAAIGGLAVLFGYIVMGLWNWLMPALFGIPVITFWQGVALVILARILFGGLNHRPVSHHRRPVRCHTPARHKGFDKWELYDEFWKEEGEKAFHAYAENRRNPNGTPKE